MRAIRLAAAMAISAGTFAAVACSVDVNIDGKSCPCGDGYVCDKSRDLCVTPAELAADGAVVLDDGAVLTPDVVVPCPDDKCPCTTDDECKDPARRKCLTDTKSCVECLRTPTDTCPAGQYCNEQNLCTLGCKQESDCQISPAVPHCNLTSHQCVECTANGQCPGDAGLLCSPSGSCVEGCDLDAGVGCPTGKTCCGQFCLNVSSDALNCGQCNNKCSTTNGTPVCTGGTCTWPNSNCAQGYRHCASGNTGCETSIRTDVTKCGSCTRNCLVDMQNADGISCNPLSMTCQYTSCKIGFGDCANPSDGCECACGSFAGQICCPGPVPCTFPGGKCVGQNPAKCQ